MPTFAPPRLTVLLCTLLLAGLAACGGGGGSAASLTAVATEQPAAPAAAPVAAAQGGAASAEPVSAPDATPASPSNSATVGTARALGVTASVALEGVPDAPLTLAAGNTTAGRQFYVDAQTGDDQRDGRTAGAGSAAGTGPWRTLARLMSAGLAAGDTVNLACGSVWRETLRLPASGLADQPITIKAAQAGCTNPPVIDGSQAIAPAAWVRHSGNIYKTPLASAPLQLHAAAGTLLAAHHPNRGHSAAEPLSPWATLAADGNVFPANGRQGSTVLTTGDDLALPAGASLGAGTRVRVRTNSYIIDDLALASADGPRLTLAGPTSYPVRAGWGYLLMGQAWMLDSPGEWHYDATARQLLAWMPDSAAPATAVAATMLSTGVDLLGRQHVVLDGITVQKVGTGIQLRNSLSVQVRNCTVQDTLDAGADAANSIQARFEANQFSRTGLDAIAGQGTDIAYAMHMTVRNNLVRDAGVRMQGELAVNLPRRNLAAISPGANATVTGNTVINAAYIGIWSLVASEMSENFVYGACTVIDDCAGIYTGGAANNGRILRNTVVHSRGAVAGKPAAARTPQAHGIYLDDWTSGVLVEDNTVIDTDHGIFLHVANRNTVRNNRLFGNRTSQIWLQETPTLATGELFGNVIEGNLIAPVSPTAVGLLLQSSYASTAAFGQFDRNRYYDRASAAAVAVSTTAGNYLYTLNQWRASQNVGSTLPVEPSGLAVSGLGFAAYAVAGSNRVANSDLARDLYGWGTWNQTAPAGRAMREACAVGTCLRYTAGGSPGVVSSPNFTLQQGQWYRLTLDVATETDNQIVPLVVRRGGGGNNGYEAVSDRALGFTAGRSFSRHTVVFQATQTIVAADPATGDLGARVDIDGITAGQSISLANVELVPITPDALAQTVGALINVGATASLQACPWAASQSMLCGKLVSLADQQVLSWPVQVPPHSALIVYAQEPGLADADRDGIADGQDECPASPVGLAVNARGCALNQR